MIFRVLGCSGSESDRSHPCSFLLGDSIAVDMGSAASRLTIEEQARLTDILISHAHLDHTKDLAFLAENVYARVSRPIRVRGTAETLKELRTNLLGGRLWPDFSVLPTETAPVLQYEPFTTGQTFRVGDVEVLAVPVNHPGTCVGMFLSSGPGSILYSGDTGPTDEIWEEVNRRGERMKAILLETSFPDSLQKLADRSGHHTPASLEREIQKIRLKNVPIFVYHMKAPYREETRRELERLTDPRIRLLEPGMTIEF